MTVFVTTIPSGRSMRWPRDPFFRLVLLATAGFLLLIFLLGFAAGALLV